VAEVIVKASAAKDKNGKDVDPNRVFKLNVEADTDMVEAIGDILTNEVECELSRLEDELNSGYLGTRGFETRESRAQHLLNKVAKYEQSFAKKLEGLQERFVRAEQSAAMAKLAALVTAEQDANAAHAE
jgi:response regulator RpfG family c-di-GMP phosphodiesterase